MSEIAYDKAKKKLRLGYFIVGVGVTFGGLMTFLIATFNEGHRVVRSWPEVEGEVISASIETDATMNRIGRRAVVNTTEYVHKCTIRYRVDGEPYYKDQPGARGSNMNQVMRRMSDRVVGAKVVMHYNPEDPAEASIHPSADTSPMVGVGLGGFLCVIGLPLIYGSKRKMRKLSLNGYGEFIGHVMPTETGITLESTKYLQGVVK